MKRKTPASLHQRILADIQERILSGRWAAGARIPFERELMAQYRCSRMTVSKVLAQLVQAGLIERRRRAGSFVRAPRTQSALLHIPEVRVEVEALGKPYHYALLSRRRRAATAKETALFGWRTPQPLLALRCLHGAGRRPFCLEERLVSLVAVPAAADESFAQLSPGAWLLQQVPWTLAEHRISATAATARVARLLAVPVGAPCLEVARMTRNLEQAITRVRLTYPADLHQLVASFQP